MKVVILGGGTAGWMTAAGLAAHLGRTVSVTLVESDTLGTIGVGEATIPQIRSYIQSVGLSEAALLQDTQATLKLGIAFIDWHSIGSEYMHGFGSVGRSPGGVPFHHYWGCYRAQGGSLGFADFCTNTRAAYAHRYGVREGAVAARLPQAAYHLDAGLFAARLRKQAEAQGVTRIEGLVQEHTLAPESGFVTSLRLEDGRVVTGDLFVDCSGFRGVLIEDAVSSGYEDWSQWLPCDRAIAWASGGRGDLAPYTRATARSAGWQWEIPLQHRTGNGHVYASAFTSDDAALAQLQQTLAGAPLGDPRWLRFQTGKRREIWKRNVVAIGLSGGFLEPLESTSIHFIQLAIARLIALFPDARCDASLARQFNEQMDFDYETIRDFLILHYCATERDDTAFWTYCRTMDLPDALAHRLRLFRETGRVQRHQTELFDVSSWVQVMLGQGLRPAALHPAVDAVETADLYRFVEQIEAETAAAVDSLGAHKDYVARVRDGATGP